MQTDKQGDLSGYMQAFVDFFNDKPRGKPRKGGSFKTGKRSKAPRNIASRKPVKR